MENHIAISDTYGVVRLRPVYSNPVTKWWTIYSCTSAMNRDTMRCRSVPKGNDEEVYKAFEKLLNSYLKSAKRFGEAKNEKERGVIDRMLARGCGILLNKSKDRDAMRNSMYKLISARANQQIVDEYIDTIRSVERQYHNRPCPPEKVLNMFKKIQDEYESSRLKLRLEGDEDIQSYVKMLNELYITAGDTLVNKTTAPPGLPPLLVLQQRISQYISGANQRMLDSYQHHINSLIWGGASDETINKAHERYEKLFQGEHKLLDVIKAERNSLKQNGTH